MSKGRALLWIVCLALLAVGARNFENGLSVDGPLYANIARKIAAGGDAFRLTSGISDFTPFVEHPHLGLWTLATTFRVLPVADWSARVPGHLFYVLFLFLFFLAVRRWSGERTAVLAVLLLWISATFSNTFSNAYLDPGALVCGFAAVAALWRAFEETRRRPALLWASLAGACLGLCALFKGFSVFGFGPAMAYLTLHALWMHRARSARTFGVAASCLAVWAVVLGLYAWALSRSAIPDFLHLYVDRQWAQRFSRTDSYLSGIFDTQFWGQLRDRSVYAIWIAPFALYFAPRRGPALWVPVILLATHVFMFAPAHLLGFQYFASVLPWVAWLAASAVAERIRLPVAAVVKWSGVVALVGMAAVQYLPFPTHRSTEPSFAALLRSTPGSESRRMYYEIVGGRPDFISTSLAAWYGRIDVVPMANDMAVPAPHEGDFYFLQGSDAVRTRAIARAGWCPKDGTLYSFCLSASDKARE